MLLIPCRHGITFSGPVSNRKPRSISNFSPSFQKASEYVQKHREEKCKKMKLCERISFSCCTGLGSCHRGKPTISSLAKFCAPPSGQFSSIQQHPTGSMDAEIHVRFLKQREQTLMLFGTKVAPSTWLMQRQHDFSGMHDMHVKTVSYGTFFHKFHQIANEIFHPAFWEEKQWTHVNSNLMKNELKKMKQHTRSQNNAIVRVPTPSDLNEVSFVRDSHESRFKHVP